MQSDFLPNLSNQTSRSLDAWRLEAAGGRFEIRLTRDAEDIAAAQRLRYEVFYEEMSAQPTEAMAAARLDFDAFDALCDHLMVFDRNRHAGQQVVGTYRLMRQPIAKLHGGFYSQSEYDLGPLLDKVGDQPGLMELGRSCVHPDYRTNATVQLLWRGIATYIADHRIDYLFGCASFPGVDPENHAESLSYLHHHHRAPEDMRVRALPERYVDMNMRPADGIEARRALIGLPPLIKAYLRLGCYIGDGAVVDHQFGTVDVFILLPVTRISNRYVVKFDKNLEESKA